MKNFFTKSLVVLFLLFVGMGQVWAEMGFNDEGTFNVQMNVNGTAQWLYAAGGANKTGVTEVDLGEVTSLTFGGYWINAWSNNSWKHKSAKLYAKVDDAAEFESWYEVTIEETEGNKQYKIENLNIDKGLVDGMEPGEHTITFYFALNDYRYAKNRNDQCYVIKYTIASSCTANTVSWTTTPADGEVGGSMTIGATATGGSVQYKSSDTDVATVVGTTLNYVGKGSATITAYVKDDATYCNAKSTQNITVSAPSYTFANGSTWYFDFSGVDCGSSSNGVNYPNATGSASFDASGCGSIKSATFKTDVKVNLGEGWGSLKTQKGGYVNITLPSSAPAAGKNCLIVSSDGKSATWGTYAPGFFLKASWNSWNGSDNNYKFVAQGGGVYTLTKNVSAGTNKEFVIRSESGTEYKYNVNTGYADTENSSASLNFGKHSSNNNFVITLSEAKDVTFTVTVTASQVKVAVMVPEAKWTGLSVARNIEAAADAPILSATSVNQGSSVEIEAKDANEGYQWYQWTVTSGGSLGSVANVKANTWTPSANNQVATANYKIKVTYDANGHGTAPDAVYAEKNATISAPTDLEATGYTFDGWYKETTCQTAWTFASDQVTVPITLYAKWTENPPCTPTSYEVWSGASKVSDMVEESTGVWTADIPLTNDNRNNFFIKDDCGNTYGCSTALTPGNSITLTSGGNHFAYNTAPNNSTYKWTYTISTGVLSSGSTNLAETRTIVIKVEKNGKTGWAVQTADRTPSGASYTTDDTDPEWYIVTFNDVVSVSNFKLAYAGGGNWYHLQSSTLTESKCYNFDGTVNSTCAITPETTNYYVYLGQDYVLPTGKTYTITSSTQAKYYDNLTESTKTYTTGCSIDGTTFHATTLGDYIVTPSDGEPFHVYVYRYYAKYPWGACDGVAGAEYNKMWKWQALEYSTTTTMKVVGLYSSKAGKKANICWDYTYDWDGVYRYDGSETANVRPGKENGAGEDGIWFNTPSESVSATTGANSYLEMSTSESLTCGDEVYIELTYTSVVDASGTTEPSVGGAYSYTSYSTSELFTLTYAAVPAEGGQVTHDQSGNKVKSGTIVTFTAAPKDGYIFDGWYSDAACTGAQITGAGVDNNRYQVTVTSNVAVYAKFIKLAEYYLVGDLVGAWTANKQKMNGVSANKYSYTTSSLAVGTYKFKITNGAWSTSEGGQDWGYSKGKSYGASSTDVVRCAATVATDDGSDSHHMQVVLSASSTVTVDFEYSGVGSATICVTVPTYTITETHTNGSITFRGEATSGTIEVGAVAGEIVATPAEGYVFTGWTTTGGANVANASASTTTLYATAEGTLTANFERETGWYLCGDAFGGYSVVKTYPYNQTYRGISNMFYREVTSTSGNHYLQVNDGTTRYGTSDGNNHELGSSYSAAVAMGTNTAKGSKFNLSGTYWFCIDASNSSNPKVWYESPKTFHTITVTETGNSEHQYATYTLTTASDGQPASKATTQYASGETYVLTVTAANDGVVPVLTVGGAETSWTSSTDNVYTYSGTMPDADLAVNISYNVTKDFIFRILRGAETIATTEQPGTALVGQTITFDYPSSGWKNFNGTPQFRFKQIIDGVTTSIDGAALVVGDIGEIVYVATASDDAFNTVQIVKTCTVTVATPQITAVAVSQEGNSTCMIKDRTLTATPTITNLGGAAPGLMVCWELKRSDGTAVETTFTPVASSNKVTFSVAETGDYTIYATLKKGASCATATTISGPTSQDFSVCNAVVDLTATGSAYVGNTIRLDWTSDGVDNPTYTLSVREPGASGFTILLNNTSSTTMNFVLSSTGDYIFHVDVKSNGAGDVLASDEVNPYTVLSKTYFIRYDFVKSNGTRAWQSKPMSYNEEDGTYYYYSDSGETQSKYNRDQNCANVWQSGSAKIDYEAPCKDMYYEGNKLTYVTSTITTGALVVFHYNADEDSLYVTTVNSDMYRVKSVCANGTYYSNAISGNGQLSFYAETTGTLKWQKFNLSTYQWEDVAAGSVSSTAITSNNVYYTPSAVDVSSTLPSSLTLKKYTGLYYIFSSLTDANIESQTANKSGKMTEFNKYSDEFYSRYWVAWVATGKNTAATVGNLINMNLANRLPDYHLPKYANLRYAYEPTTNYFSRTTIAGSTDLVDKFVGAYGQNVRETNGGSDATNLASAIILKDGSNWVYTADVYADHDSYIKLAAQYNGNYTYLLSSTGLDLESAKRYLNAPENSGLSNNARFHVVYDYKLNRMLTGWDPEDVSEPSATNSIDGLFIRRTDDQEAYQIGDITNGKSINVVKRLSYELNITREFYDEWVTEDWGAGNKVLYFWFSLPFKCKITDIFGYGMSNTDWEVQRYAGDLRDKGTWGGTGWRTLAKSATMEANRGYVLAIKINENDFKSVTIGGKTISVIRIYFPSVENETVTLGTEPTDNLPAWTTNVDPIQRDWHAMGVPVLRSGCSFTNSSPFEFVYRWTWAGGGRWYEPLKIHDTTNGKNFNFKFGHAYMVQGHGDLTWNYTKQDNLYNAPRRSTAQTGCDFRINLLQDDERVDQTYVLYRTNSSRAYEVGLDLEKIENAGRSMIYTELDSKLASICLADTDQVQIPLTIVAAADANYSMTLNTMSTSCKMILTDALLNEQTILSQGAYDLYLPQGIYKNRFFLNVIPSTGDDPVVTGLTETSGHVAITTLQDGVLLNGLHTGLPVSLYDAAGRLLYHHTVATEHSLQVPMLGATGVYLLRVGQDTYRMIK